MAEQHSVATGHWNDYKVNASLFLPPSVTDVPIRRNWRIWARVRQNFKLKARLHYSVFWVRHG